MTTEPVEEYKLYVGVSARNAGVFNAGSVWAIRLEDSSEVAVWVNTESPPEFSQHNAHDAYFYAVLEALPFVPEGGQLRLVAKERSELWWPFHLGPDGPVPLHHRKANGEAFKDEKLIRQIDALAQQRQITIWANRPQTPEEREQWAQARDDARLRRDAAEAVTASPDAKF